MHNKLKCATKKGGIEVVTYGLRLTHVFNVLLRGTFDTAQLLLLYIAADVCYLMVGLVFSPGSTEFRRFVAIAGCRCSSRRNGCGDK